MLAKAKEVKAEHPGATFEAISYHLREYNCKSGLCLRSA